MLKFSRESTGVLLCAISLSSAAAFWTPETIHHFNAENFALGWGALRGRLLVLALALAAALAVVLRALGRRIGGERVSAFAAAGAAAVFVQSQFLLWDFGPLSGVGRQTYWRAPVLVDTVVWGFFIASALSGRRWWARNAISAAALSLAGYGLAYGLHAGPRSVPAAAPALTREQALRFSPRGNKVLIVLDAAQSDLFSEISLETGFNAKSLPGYIYFRNALAAYPQTLAAVPALLSGEQYRQPMTLRSYLEKALNGGRLVGALTRAGYETQMAVAADILCDKTAARCAAVETLLLERPALVRLTVVQLLDLSLHRILPAPLKVFQRNHDIWVLRDFSKLESAQGFHELHAGFFETLGAELAAGGAEPAFKYFHFLFTHAPPRLDADCRVAAGRRGEREAMKDQVRCAVKLLGSFNAALQRAGVYDVSEIIVAADHGNGFSPYNLEENARQTNVSPHTLGLAYPTLLWKPAGRRKAFAVSEAPASLEDVAPTLCGRLCAGDAFPAGVPLGRLPDRAGRPRIFNAMVIPETSADAEGAVKFEGHAFSLDQSPSLRAYRVDGAAYLGRDWRRMPNYSPGRRFRIPATLDFSPALRYEEFSAGWDVPVYDPRAKSHFTWATGDQASIYLQAAPGDYTVSVTAETHPNNAGQMVSVLNGDALLAKFPLTTGRTTHRFALRVDGPEPAPELDFRFSKHRPPPGTRDPRPLAAQFWAIEISAP